jgi:hypothetical protein
MCIGAGISDIRADRHDGITAVVKQGLSRSRFVSHTAVFCGMFVASDVSALRLNRFLVNLFC